MKLTAPKLTSLTALSAIVAGLLFVAIQVVHPSDTLASVTTSAWAIVHYVSVVMALLFVIGIAGIFVSQVEQVGWLGLAGFVVLSLGLLVTAALQFVEATVEPTLAATNPGYVEGLLGTVGGHASSVDLGAIATFVSLASALFLGGTLLFGIATLRAGILPRPASALFAFGLLLVGPVAAAVEAPRLAAVPIGLGLAWMGYGLWSQRHQSSTERTPVAAALRPNRTTT